MIELRGANNGGGRVAVCRGLIEQRRQVGKYIGFKLCPDPAWDMLLDLYHSEYLGRHISLSSLSHASNVPATTAARCIGELVVAGLIEREPDPRDGRKINVRLTATGRNKMEQILDELATISSL